MNTQNVWIKRSEREPTEADLPIVMGGYICGSGKVWDIALYSCLPPKSHWSGYWRSIKAEPPPRELTQREADWALAKAVTQNWYKVEGGSEELALLAIYAERREVAKLMADWFRQSDWGTHDGISPQCKALRARLDEQGAK